jgi:TPR repeat protein
LLGVGQNCKDDAVPDELQNTLAQSCRGNQYSSLAIGKYFEELALGSVDNSYYAKAAKYYGIAATSSSGQTYIYVPGAGEVAGYTMPVTTGVPTNGVAEAQYRLGLLYSSGLGVRKSKGRANKHFKMAAKQGYVSACPHLPEGEVRQISHCSSLK